ncbi:MAG: hypothetical protein GTN73_03795 [Candidatus Aminicenantes bacterium]|nr:hypothetical protein [Candidatus Aminicenantes bacterium]
MVEKTVRKAEFGFRFFREVYSEMKSSPVLNMISKSDPERSLYPSSFLGEQSRFSLSVFETPSLIVYVQSRKKDAYNRI